MMKRLGASDELIGNRTLLLVGAEFAIFIRSLFFESLEAIQNLVRSGFGVGVVDSHLIQPASQKSPLERRSLAIRQFSLIRINTK